MVSQRPASRTVWRSGLRGQVAASRGTHRTRLTGCNSSRPGAAASALRPLIARRWASVKPCSPAPAPLGAVGVEVTDGDRVAHDELVPPGTRPRLKTRWASLGGRSRCRFGRRGFPDATWRGSVPRPGGGRAAACGGLSGGGSADRRHPNANKPAVRGLFQPVGVSQQAGAGACPRRRIGSPRAAAQRERSTPSRVAEPTLSQSGSTSWPSAACAATGIDHASTTASVRRPQTSAPPQRREVGGAGAPAEFLPHDADGAEVRRRAGEQEDQRGPEAHAGEQEGGGDGRAGGGAEVHRHAEQHHAEHRREPAAPARDGAGRHERLHERSEEDAERQPEGDVAEQLVGGVADGFDRLGPLPLRGLGGDAAAGGAAGLCGGGLQEAGPLAAPVACPQVRKSFVSRKFLTICPETGIRGRFPQASHRATVRG